MNETFLIIKENIYQFRKIYVLVISIFILMFFVLSLLVSKKKAGKLISLSQNDISDKPTHWLPMNFIITLLALYLFLSFNILITFIAYIGGLWAVFSFYNKKLFQKINGVYTNGFILDTSFISWIKIHSWEKTDGDMISLTLKSGFHKDFINGIEIDRVEKIIASKINL